MDLEGLSGTAKLNATPRLEDSAHASRARTGHSGAAAYRSSAMARRILLDRRFSKRLITDVGRGRLRGFA